jgi:hypothetical protein
MKTTGTFTSKTTGCKACHGLDLLGTVLAAMPAARTFTVEGNQISYAKGDLVACNRLHGRPSL